MITSDTPNASLLQAMYGFRQLRQYLNIPDNTKYSLNLLKLSDFVDLGVSYLNLPEFVI